MSEAGDSTKAPKENTLETIREDLVSTAIKFLENPRVASRPRSEKEVFLERKGLTRAEILAAFEACNQPSDHTVEHFSSVKVSQVRGYSNSLAPPLKSRWDFVRDILNSIILVGGASYSIHYLYKKFIAPWLFSREKEKSLPDMVEEMNQNLTRLVADVSAAVQNLSVTVSTLQSKQSDQAELKELKAEVASLKALLLSRRQFPAPPALVTGPPSIPSWQLGSSTNEKMDMQIISVEDMPSTSGAHAASQLRDPSESSESNSAEMVDMAASASGGSGEDTD